MKTFICIIQSLLTGIFLSSCTAPTQCTTTTVNGVPSIVETPLPVLKELNFSKLCEQTINSRF